MYSGLNTPSEYTYIYFYISKNITSYTFLLDFKITESLQCILKFFIKTFRFLQSSTLYDLVNDFLKYRYVTV